MREEFDELDELQEDECPCCRMMREEWGMVEDVPFTLLESKGIRLADPATLDDAELHGVLWQVIHELASMRIFLECTDHLSERQLYEELWREILRESMMFAPTDVYSACHIDMSGAGSGDESRTWLRYYADEETRERWRRDFPDAAVPPHEDPPYRRDELLPQPFDVFETLQ